MTALETRNQVVKTIKSIAEKNTYSQAANKRSKVFDTPGYGDCSSTVRECWRKVTGIDIGSYTVAQITNKNLVQVCLPNSSGQPDEAKMLPGDLLYFEGSNASRPYKVGHVEMYTGKDELYGHGSGKGPRKIGMKSYCKSRKLIKVLRVPLAGDTDTTDHKLGARELAYGSKGPDVAELQTNLVTLGYSVGKWGADGEYGTSTKAAVKAYQHDAGLSIKRKGTYGIKTHRAMTVAIDALSDPADTDNTDNAASVAGYLTQTVKTSGAVHLRTAPSTAGGKVAVAESGASLSAISADNGSLVVVNGWYAVLHGADVVWVSGKYIVRQE